MVDLEVIALIVSIVGFTPLYIDLFIRLREGRPQFILERFHEPVKKPVHSDWSIRILHPNRPIERCTVLFNNESLPWWDRDEPYYERRIVTGGGGNVRIPKEIEEEDADVTVKNGKRTLRKTRFNEIHIDHRG